MKKFILILCALAPVFTACAQITNGTKISALPSATLPLTGNEIVPLNQGSGTNSTKTAKVSDIISSAVTAASAAQGYASAISNQTAAVTASHFNTSNSLNTVSNNFQVTSNRFASWSNSVATALGALGALANQSSVTLSQVSNAGSIAMRGSNDFYLASNPAGYQNGAQVSSTVNSAIVAAQAGVVTNNGTAIFRNVWTPSIDLGGFTTISGVDTTNILIDLSAAAYQTIELVPRSGGASNFKFIFTNAVDGQNVWLLATVTNSGIAWKFQPLGAVDNWNSGSVPYSASSVQKSALLNWQVVGGLVIFTSSIHP